MRPAPLTTNRVPAAPRLLLLVFGIFLMLTGVTASALVAVTSAHLADATLSAVVERDRSLVDLFANGNLVVADLQQPGPGPNRLREIQGSIEALTETDEILAFQVRDRDGALVVSSTGSAALEPSARGLALALRGEANAEFSGDDDASVLEERLPLVTEDGAVHGAIVLQRDGAHVTASLGDASRDVLLVTLGATALLAGILVLVFKSAHVRLVRQHEQLAEAARRDALTGLLNHGSIVSLLADAVERATASACSTIRMATRQGTRSCSRSRSSSQRPPALMGTRPATGPMSSSSCAQGSTPRRSRPRRPTFAPRSGRSPSGSTAPRSCRSA
jgi:hypothetical protein